MAAQLIPVLALLMVGWGWNDWAGFFSHPARAGLMVALILGAGSALLLRLDLQPLRRGRSLVGGQTLVLLALALASLFLVWFLPFADRRQILTFTGSPALRYLGLAMCCLGIAVRLLALGKLGRWFSAYVTLQDDHQLVQSGIYGVIRHPLYLSLLLAAPGFALVFASMLALPILLVAVVFVTIRFRQEEDLLESHFGSEFRAYRRRTGALLPRIIVATSAGNSP